mmetsp:Transcript_2226/g.3362  ORF Transcript_2226/g.3362 Transcript_2226/m.3362 type:complete len:93 (+) Transcript_2226:642-920(+)|eukprot:CAMPEP_0170512234 /NCGR_PEP_ID=MMETSP0208-20121228/66739_1 /TAXON_ID=197538 /ORGANISM="Strombidium inclinatum, Strain S3" /LENGTH=92 /DNA_ID=CAMNT_0010795847 /DNA_START=1385 /DNA_END=1663 /DNA_ORIENTATION=+
MSVFTGFLDVAMKKNGPRHLFTKTSVEGYVHLIPKQPQQCGAVLNTQPVSPKDSFDFYIPQFHYLFGKEEIPLPSGEDNAFYGIFMALFFIR